MKKVFQVFAVAFIASVAFLNVNSAGAVEIDSPSCGTIIITNTGENSNNEGTCTVVRNIVLECKDNINVLSENDQQAVTGDAQSLGNTTSGTAITGSATNVNGQVVEIGSKGCATTTSTTTTTSPSPTPSSTPTPSKPKTLPYTASNSTLSIVAISLATAAAAVVASRVAVAAYRRIGSK